MMTMIILLGWLKKLVGLFLIVYGLWLGLAVLAFATMIDPEFAPDLQGQAWWDEYWKVMIEGGGLLSLVVGLAMVIVGGTLLVSPLRPKAGVKTIGPKKSPRDPEIA